VTTQAHFTESVVFVMKKHAFGAGACSGACCSLNRKDFLSLKEQQAPEQAPTSKVQYVVVKNTLLAKWGGCLWVLVRLKSTQVKVFKEGRGKPRESSCDEAHRAQSYGFEPNRKPIHVHLY
jgi:hypothetical protein